MGTMSLFRNLKPKTLPTKNDVWPAQMLLLACSFLAILLGYFVAEVFTANPWGLQYLGEAPALRANDLTRLMEASRGFAPLQGVPRVLPGEPVPYPPAAFVYFGVLASMPVKWAMAAFYLPCLLYLWVAARIAVAASENLKQRALWLAAIAFCYPLLYVLDRANLDAYAGLGCFAFVYFFTGDKTKLAAIILGTVAALKLYPALLSVLLIKRDPRGMLLFVAVFAIESLASLWILSQTPSAAIQVFIQQLSKSDFCYSSISLCLNLSAAVPFKVLLASLVTSNWYASFSDIVPTLYGIFSIALVIYAVGLVLLRNAPLWQNVLLLTCVMNFVPVMSYDYKLILYLVPLVLMLEHCPRDKTMAAIIFMVAVMLSSFKWLSGPLHLWIHAITQIGLFFVAMLSAQQISELLAAPLTWIMRQRVTAFALTTCLVVLVAWNFIGANVMRRAWASSQSWCPNTFTFSQKDPAAIWGSGWSSFDNASGSQWRWTTASVARLYIPVNSGRVAFSGQVALPPGSPDGSVQIVAAGLVKAVVPIKTGESKSFAFDLNTSPAATDENTIAVEFHAPALVPAGDRKLGAVVSGLKLNSSCRP